MCDIKSTNRGNTLAKTCATYYHAQLGLPGKGSKIRGWLSSIVRMLMPFDLLERRHTLLLTVLLISMYVHCKIGLDDSDLTE